MSYQYNKTLPQEFEQYITEEASSAKPALSVMQEVILIYLKELSYYLLKLKKFATDDKIIMENVIEAVSGIIANIDYNHSQFRKLIEILSKDLTRSKNLYLTLCERNEVKPELIKPFFKHADNFTMEEMLISANKNLQARNSLPKEQKDSFDLIISLIKNLCLKILQIKSYKKNYEDAYNSIISLLNPLNFETDSGVKDITEKAIFQHDRITKRLSLAQVDAHGKRQGISIPFNPKYGKCILVSGIDLTVLEKVLEAVKNKKIDVYTHGMTMLAAHGLANFKKYKNLVGHFGKGSDSSLFDFAAFPGAILMTRYLFQKVEYLYRPRLFTTDSYAPSGVGKIKDNNFEPLIQAALDTKGFSQQQIEAILRAGYKQKELEARCDEIVNKFRNKQIKYLFIMGLLPYENKYSDYFKKIFELIPKNVYVLSFTNDAVKENILHLDVFYDYLFIYNILERINRKLNLTTMDITFFITKCDLYTTANIINFINMGIKKIYMCKCDQKLINPAIGETLKNIFEVKEFSTPEKDLTEILSK